MSTPVQRQYQELKKLNPDAILFFRLGDFYEMFYEDAQIASRILGITLTARHKGTENEMPMSGIPYHAHEEYLEKLIESGYRVAIAEQFEDPETKVITRKIDRVVTPGTSLESGNLKADENNFLVAIMAPESLSEGKEAEPRHKKKSFALAVSDLSTGEFRTAVFEEEISFLDELYKLAPREILIPSGLYDDEKFCQKLPKSHLTPRKDIKADQASNILKTHFGVQNLDAFGLEKFTILIIVSGMVLDYLAETQKADLSHIQKIVRYSTSDVMALDGQTFRHLEIFQPIYADETAATLHSVFEKCFTPMGGRQLRYWLANPLLDAEKINQRLRSVEEMITHPNLSDKLTEILKPITDLERILARLVTGRGNGRDLAFFRDSFSDFPNLKQILASCETVLLKEIAPTFEGLETLFALLNKSLLPEPALDITSGGIIQDGYNDELDELRNLAKESQNWLEDYLEFKKKETGLSNLRVKYSKNFGFCLEVSKANASKVPESWIRRQTLTNAERFTTPELAEYEEKVLGAEARAYELEHQLFLTLREETLKCTPKIQAAAQAIGQIDALTGLARTAEKWRWVKPEIMAPEANQPQFFDVKNGRHPVVEKISTEIFIANDCRMHSDKSRIHLITGPNMAGKSTYLRQNALIVLLGQIGSFVPAESARFHVCDRIFTRVGASDNLAGGKSTFFVEMAETASILNAATDRSFVILDEIGRGTSTFDGISLAWAITEFLHDQIGAKTLFATHYHELIDLADGLSAAQNYHVSVSQNQHGIMFLRKILPGGISDSFGIDVAASAGIPKSVITKAREILAELESENLLSGKSAQPSLFAQPRVRETVVEVEKASAVDHKLAEINPDELSPKEALEILYMLKRL